MAWKLDSGLTPPERIWRYMSVPALFDLLQKQALFFPTISTLRTVDPWEACIPNTKRREIGLRGISQHDNPKLLSTALIGQNVDLESFVDLLALEGRTEDTAVCCWHRNSVESAAMWAIYARPHGVAITSTVGRLQKSLDQTIDGVISPVLYCEHPASSDSPHLTKRKSFEHESEIRAVVEAPQGRKATKSAGLHVSVGSVSDLIDQVWVSPLAEDWVSDVISREVRRIHNLTAIRVRKSPLNRVW